MDLDDILNRAEQHETVAAQNEGASLGGEGFLEQFANIQDLQTFYADQRPDALNSSFTTILINGTCLSGVSGWRRARTPISLLRRWREQSNPGRGRPGG